MASRHLNISAICNCWTCHSKSMGMKQLPQLFWFQSQTRLLNLAAGISTHSARRASGVEATSAGLCGGTEKQTHLGASLHSVLELCINKALFPTWEQQHLQRDFSIHNRFAEYFSSHAGSDLSTQSPYLRNSEQCVGPLNVSTCFGSFCIYDRIYVILTPNMSCLAALTSKWNLTGSFFKN